MSDQGAVKITAPECPHCGAPLELMGDGTCRWCHVLVKLQRPAEPTFTGFAGPTVEQYTAATVKLGDYRSYPEPSATLFGWVDTLRQPLLPAGLEVGDITQNFISVLTAIRGRIVRVSGIAWDDHAVPREKRQEFAADLLTLLDLVGAMGAAKADRALGEQATQTVARVRDQLGHHFKVDPHHVTRHFEHLPALSAWVATQL